MCRGWGACLKRCLERRVFELLQRARLDLHRCWLGGEPAPSPVKGSLPKRFFLAGTCCRPIFNRPGKVNSPIPSCAPNPGWRFQCGENCLGCLGLHTRLLYQVSDQRGLVENRLDGLDGNRCRFGGNRRDLLGGGCRFRSLLDGSGCLLCSCHGGSCWVGELICAA